MINLADLWLRFRSALFRGRVERELQDELHFHIEMQTRKNVTQGMDPNEARRQALVRLGGLTAVAEGCRTQRGLSFFENVVRDVHHAARLMRRSPGFTAVAVLSLALGIGGNTAVFTIINAIFLKPLPVRDIQSLYAVGTSDLKLPSKGGFLPISFPNFEDVQRQNSVFSHMAASRYVEFLFKDGARTETIQGQLVTVDYFKLLGVDAVIGRTFSADDDLTAGNEFVAVISHSFWSRQFAESKDVIGKQIVLNSRVFTIIGVTPREFKGTRVIGSDQLWIPFRAKPELSLAASRRDVCCLAIGRLKSGIARRQIETEMNTIAARLEQEYPRENAGRRFDVQRLSDVVHNTTSGSPFVVLVGMAIAGVVLILIVTCMNLTGLLLARSAARYREISIRAALGGNRRRLVQQLLTESVLLAFLGGAAALTAAYWVRAAIWSMHPAGDMEALDLTFDGGVLLFTAGVSVFAGIVVGLVPAIKASRPDLIEAIRGGSLTVGQWGRSRIRTFLVVTEISLSLIALICAGVFARMVHTAQTRDIGFAWEALGHVEVDLSNAGLSPQQARQFYRDALLRVGSMPEVEAVMVQSGMSRIGPAIFTEEGENDPSYHPGPTMRQVISHNFFDAVDVAPRVGRVFTKEDRQNSTPVAIISQSTAESFWPGTNPVGKRFHFYGDRVMREVVGVVPDIGFWVVPQHKIAVYLPIEQVYEPTANLQIRSIADTPTAVLSKVRDEIQRLNSNVEIKSLSTYGENISRSLQPFRVLTTALIAASLMTAALAIIGLYGVISYSVAQRTKEIGVRMTLGARRKDILRMVFGQGMRLTFIGVVAGIFIARSVTPLFSRLLYFGASATDPIAFVGATIMLLAVVVVACYVPARRAANVDPWLALRHE